MLLDFTEHKLTTFSGKHRVAIFAQQRAEWYWSIGVGLAANEKKIETTRRLKFLGLHQLRATWSTPQCQDRFCLDLRWMHTEGAVATEGGRSPAGVATAAAISESLGSSCFCEVHLVRHAPPTPTDEGLRLARGDLGHGLQACPRSRKALAKTQRPSPHTKGHRRRRLRRRNRKTGCIMAQAKDAFIHNIRHYLSGEPKARFPHFGQMYAFRISLLCCAYSSIT